MTNMECVGYPCHRAIVAPPYTLPQEATPNHLCQPWHLVGRRAPGDKRVVAIQEGERQRHLNHKKPGAFLCLEKPCRKTKVKNLSFSHPMICSRLDAEALSTGPSARLDALSGLGRRQKPCKVSMGSLPPPPRLSLSLSRSMCLTQLFSPLSLSLVVSDSLSLSLSPPSLSLYVSICLRIYPATNTPPPRRAQRATPTTAAHARACSCPGHV